MILHMQLLDSAKTDKKERKDAKQTTNKGQRKWHIDTVGVSDLMPKWDVKTDG